jgi:xanthine dehydrogenase accessory protein XdhC
LPGLVGWAVITGPAYAPSASAGPPAILVTVREVLGSAPRAAGTWMIVTATGIEGTIGGGNLEWRAIEAARDMLGGGEARRELALPLGPTLTQCCGGHVALELVRLGPDTQAELAQAIAAERATWPTVALFGAGHVGRALIHALAPLPCRITWIDSRPGIFPEPVGSSIQTITSEHPAERVRHLPAGSFVLVMTHSHPLDLDIIDAALRRPDLAWLGLIGSETKRRRFESQLRARGLSPEAIARLVCPIGLQGIAGKEPAVIAASVAAQLLIAFEARARHLSVAGAG